MLALQSIYIYYVNLPYLIYRSICSVQSPLSPFFFNLAAGVLNKLLKRAQNASKCRSNSGVREFFKFR
jgi:hypothetical protein